MSWDVGSLARGKMQIDASLTDGWLRAPSAMQQSTM
jgi:hypothetical protein